MKKQQKNSVRASARLSPVADMSRVIIWIFLSVCAAEVAVADTGVNQATQADEAFAKYGLTGKGSHCRNPRPRN